VFVTLGGMASADETSDRAADAWAEALAVVQDALEWQLAELGWQAVEQMLITMHAAVEVGDPRALAAATADLEMIAPVRVIKIGAPANPPPPPVRDRLNRLVHSLGDASTAQRPQPQDPRAAEAQ
jgi:hypothetical protein